MAQPLFRLASRAVLLLTALAAGCGDGGTTGTSGTTGAAQTGSGGSGGVGDTSGSGGSGASGGAGGSTPTPEDCQNGLDDDGDKATDCEDTECAAAPSCAPPTCGNGALDPDELCDTAIPEGESGACPTSCDDVDACSIDALVGTACTLACQHDPVPAADGDGCCPESAGTDTDNDCKPLYPAGQAIDVCNGTFHVPTLAMGGGHFAVGCLRDGNQNETPQVKILDAQGALIQSNPLLLTDGYYYNDIQLTYFEDRFQAVYQYNCDDSGSWQVGWGWGCIDFREWSADGAEVTPSLVFGETGHNGHPVLAHDGAGFGVAWVSYDNLYFRGIDANRKLVGGDKLDNVFLAHDPNSSDDRNGARTKIAWDGAGYGIFSIIGGQLFFARVDPSGAAIVPLKYLTSAFSQTFSGQFTALYQNGAYFVVYPQPSAMGADFIKVSMTGEVVATAPIVSGIDLRFPQMLAKDGLFYVFTNDAANNVKLTVLDETASILAGKSGLIDEGQPMPFPVPAFDPSTGEIGIAYLDPGWGGDVKLRRYKLTP